MIQEIIRVSYQILLEKELLSRKSIWMCSVKIKNVRFVKKIASIQFILDVPTVEVVMIPEGPVKESDESNVTLFCNILDANPSILTKVRWYANSTLLKELPDCEETNVSNQKMLKYYYVGKI